MPETASLKSDDLMSRSDAAELLDVSVDTVKRYGKAGLLEERHIGPRLVKVTRASVEAMARSSEGGAA
jgi:predicted site-specific integrase-resolvase